MDWILTCLLSLGAAAGLMAYGFVSWLYDADVPHPLIVLDDLKALRTTFGVLHIGTAALTSFFADTEKHQP